MIISSNTIQTEQVLTRMISDRLEHNTPVGSSKTSKKSKREFGNSVLLNEKINLLNDV